MALHERSRTQFNIQVNSKSFPFSRNLEQKPTNSGSASEQRLRPDIQRFHSTEPPFLESIDSSAGDEIVGANAQAYEFQFQSMRETIFGEVHMW